MPCYSSTLSSDSKFTIKIWTEKEWAKNWRVVGENSQSKKVEYLFLKVSCANFYAEYDGTLYSSKNQRFVDEVIWITKAKSCKSILGPQWNHTPKTLLSKCLGVDIPRLAFKPNCQQFFSENLNLLFSKIQTREIRPSIFGLF